MASKIETPMSTLIARYHLGDRPCSGCDGAGCGKCFRTGKQPKSSSWMSGLKSLMGVKSDSVFLSACVAWIKRHPDFSASAAYTRANRLWSVVTQNALGQRASHLITANSVTIVGGANSRGVKVGRNEVQFADAVVEIKNHPPSPKKGH